MSPLLKKLVHEFQFLPGIGEKTAQRFVHFIFSRHHEKAFQFANTLLECLQQIKHCQQCQNLSENKLCDICANTNRDSQILCVVEHPSNILIMEAAQAFKGRYFVLHGALSPIDGIGPKDLHIHKLIQLIETQDIKEIIVATSSKIEGEATAFYLYDQLKDMVLVSRLGYGIPIGGSLDYLDGQTLFRAMSNRQALSDNCE
jgi:recombination protein RecR